MNLYLTIEQYFSQSFPYLIEHLVIESVSFAPIREEDDEPFKVASTPMNENSDEEQGVEIWDGSGEAHDSAPSETHSPVGNIILFTK